MVLVNPVGDYYKGGMGNPVKALIKYGFDRAASHGTGNVKLGGNYAPVFLPTNEARKRNFQIMLFLDPKEGKYVEEFATSNFVGIKAPDSNGIVIPSWLIIGKRTYVTSHSKSILASVTNRSLMYLAKKEFGWKIEKRIVEWKEVAMNEFEEIAACGTAVVITPVSEIHREYLTNDAIKKLKSDPFADEEFGENEILIEKVEMKGVEFSGLKELYKAYRALQVGELDGWESYKWMYPSEGY